jgi:2-(1,2-epoxy-1,2-dihydrophenyl)acetyl-CoA isomerase
MSKYNNITLEKREGVAILTLNNPESRNPLTEETKDELLDVLENIKDDDLSRALVITGNGPAFCAGGDLKKISIKLTHDETEQVMKKSQRLLLSLVNLEKPVIAAVNGDAFGMGFNLALAADFIIASEKATFSEVFVKIGLIPDFGAMYFLPRLIGIQKSKELIYFGSAINAKDALSYGIVYKVVPHDQLDEQSFKLANKLAKSPTKAIGKAKKVLNKAFNLTLEEILDKELEAQTYLTDTEDHQEGIQAFLEKRLPIFKGK